MRLRSLLPICAVSLLMFVRTHAGAPPQNPQSTFQSEVIQKWKVESKKWKAAE
jgi:hypothetical protein